MKRKGHTFYHLAACLLFIALSGCVNDQDPGEDSSFQVAARHSLATVDNGEAYVAKHVGRYYSNENTVSIDCPTSDTTSIGFDFIVMSGDDSAALRVRFFRQGEKHTYAVAPYSGMVRILAFDSAIPKISMKFDLIYFDTLTKRNVNVRGELNSCYLMPEGSFGQMRFEGQKITTYAAECLGSISDDGKALRIFATQRIDILYGFERVDLDLRLTEPTIGKFVFPRYTASAKYLKNSRYSFDTAQYQSLKEDTLTITAYDPIRLRASGEFSIEGYRGRFTDAWCGTIQ